MLDPYPRIESPFDELVVAARPGREDLTDPVGRERDGLFARQLREAFSAPARDVRREFGCVGELNARLLEDDPPARTAAAPIEGAVDIASDARLGALVRTARARKRVERAVNDLAAPCARQPIQIAKHGWAIKHDGPERGALRRAAGR